MTTAPSIPKIHPLIRRTLVNDVTIRRFTQDRVFAGKKLPEGTELPAVNIDLEFSSSVAPPSARHWAFTGAVECLAETWEDAEDLGEAVLTALLSLIGTSHVEGVVIDVFDWGVQSVEAGEWTPPKPQQIVTVTVTARAA